MLLKVPNDVCMYVCGLAFARSAYRLESGKSVAAANLGTMTLHLDTEHNDVVLELHACEDLSATDVSLLQTTCQHFFFGRSTC